MSVEKACAILEEGAGVQWDKELVRQFIAIAPSLATKISSLPNGNNKAN